MIDALSFVQEPFGLPASPPVMSLADRVSSTSRTAAPANDANAVADADLEALYAALLSQQDDFDAYAFLKDYVNGEGDKPFRTTGVQMEALQKVMARLKEDGHADSDAYDLALKAFGKAYSMNFMLMAYMNEAMAASEDEDSLENIEW